MSVPFYNRILSTVMNGKISLARIYYPVKVLGPGRRVGIWMNGCGKQCPGCISPEMRYYDPAKEMTVNDIVKMIAAIDGGIDGFTVSGGEPFYDPAALNALVLALSEISDDILIFTGYTLEELRARKSDEIDSVLKHCAAIVDGPFQKDRKVRQGLRGSSNQRIFVFRHHDRYADAKTQDRSLQTVVYTNGVWTIGIP